MKPIVIIGEKEKTFSAEELKKYVEDAYFQGYEDGKRAESTATGLASWQESLRNAPKNDTPFWDYTKVTCQKVTH